MAHIVVEHLGVVHPSVRLFMPENLLSVHRGWRHLGRFSV